MTVLAPFDVEGKWWISIIKQKKSESENLKEKTETEFTSQEVELDQKEEDNAITYEIKIGGGD